MLRPDVSIKAVYLHRSPVDFRCQIDGLAALVENSLSMDPFSGSLYVFINRRRDKLKMLVWETNGFILYYKRLEAERFSWPSLEGETQVTISAKELDWLLDGYNIFDLKPHQRLKFAFAS